MYGRGQWYICYLLLIVYRRRGRPPKHPQALTGRVLLARDGTVKRQSENIPSDLQKTISDAIRKARNRQYEPRQHSVNQAYSGASSTGQ